MSAEQRYWYEKALQKVKAFLPELDENLVVTVRRVGVTLTPGKSYAEHRSTLALSFSHRTNPEIKWTMEIGENDDYIENQLRETVTKIFKEHRGW